MVDNLKIKNLQRILDSGQSGEGVALRAEFKMSLNAYLSDLLQSPVRSLLDVIAFNNKHSIEVIKPQIAVLTLFTMPID